MVLDGTARLLAIGWDGVDATLVRDLLAAGRLPNLALLQTAGAMTNVAQLPGTGDDAHRATFSIGTEPGDHGRFHHVQPRTGTYLDVDIDRRDMTDKPFWERLDTAGRRVVVIDVPKSPLAELSRGFEVTDWMVHGPDGPAVRARDPQVARQW
jgi:predicted AlkP superfamily phosphohydrolase/phosphomutase